jgi:DNA-binding transcriptional regulator YdaS (Cro superfamily)
MEELRQYLNSLRPPDQESFASRCDTSLGYLRKAISKGQELGTELVISIERESGGVVRCEHLRPDIDWKYLSKRNPSMHEVAQ